MKDFAISGSMLEELSITPSELMTDLAVHLYNKERFLMGQAKKWQGSPQIEFQKEMFS